jgi:enoyl-CoA hydratase/carnithine racemase
MLLFKERKFFSVLTKTFSSLITYENIPKVNDMGLITIRNAAKKNSLSFSMVQSLDTIFNKIEEDFQKKRSPKVVIIASEGDVYCSGHNLLELMKSSNEKRAQIFKTMGNMTAKMHSLGTVFIAEVQALATAAGTQLSTSCDLIVASSKAKFQTPGRIGLFCSTPGVAVSRCIAPKRAMQMLTTGNAISAKTAYDWGLVNEIVDVEGLNEKEQRKKLRETTLALGKKIIKNLSQSPAYSKKDFYNCLI